MRNTSVSCVVTVAHTEAEKKSGVPFRSQILKENQWIFVLAKRAQNRMLGQIPPESTSGRLRRANVYLWIMYVQFCCTGTRGLGITDGGRGQGDQWLFVASLLRWLPKLITFPSHSDANG